MSRELQTTLWKPLEERKRINPARGKTDICDEWVFPAPGGGVLDPDNLYHRYFVPVLNKAKIRQIRLHDLRHSFGSQLLQKGASIVYVKEQLGHLSSQVTVDTYGRLVPGADVGFVDRLDPEPRKRMRTMKQQPASSAQPGVDGKNGIPACLSC